MFNRATSQFSEINKTYIFGLFVLCVNLQSAFANPTIHIPHSKIEGVRVLNQATTFEFDIENTGDEELLLKSVKKSCGCADANFTTNKIPPSGKAKLIVVLRPENVKKNYSVDLVIESNAINEPRATVNLSGKIVAGEIQIEPSIVSMELYPQLNTKETEILISSQESIELKDITIISLDLMGQKYVDEGLFKISSRQESENRISIKVGCVLRDGLEDSIYSLQLKVLRASKEHNLKVPVKIDVQEDFYFRPRKIHIPVSNEAKNYSMRALLKNRRGEKFDIEFIKPESDIIQVEEKSVSTGAYYIYFNIPNDAVLYNKKVMTQIGIFQDGQHTVLEYELMFKSTQSLGVIRAKELETVNN